MPIGHNPNSFEPNTVLEMPGGKNVKRFKRYIGPEMTGGPEQCLSKIQGQRCLKAITHRGLIDIQGQRWSKTKTRRDLSDIHGQRCPEVRTYEICAI